MKKGTRICAAGLLALTMALGAAPALGVLSPATALADTTVTANGAEVTVAKDHFAVVSANGNVVATQEASKLSNYLQYWVSAGDTIVLGEGTFAVGDIQLKNVCTIQGAGVGATVVTGTIEMPWRSYDFDRTDTVKIANLTMQATDGGQDAVEVRTPGLKVDVSGCEFSGYENGVLVGWDSNKNTVVTMDGAKLTNVITGIKIQDGTGSLGTVSFTDDSTYFFAVRGYSYGRDGVYSTVDAYLNDEKGSDTWNNVRTDNKLEINDVTPYWNPTAKGYVCVATNGDYKYTHLNAAIGKTDNNDTVTLVADTTMDASHIADVYSSNVTVDGAGHAITVNASHIGVHADNFTVQNVTVLGIADAKGALFQLFGADSTAPINVNFKDVSLDNRGGKYAIDADHANVTIDGKFDVTNGVGAEAGILAENTAARKLSSVTLAAGAVVSQNNQGGANLPLVRADSYGKSQEFPTVTAADATTIGVDVQNVMAPDGKTIDHQAVYVHNHVLETQNQKDATAEEDGYTGDQVCTICGETIVKGETIPATGYENVVLYRLYNPFSTEHLYTASAAERDSLVSVGWKYEGEAWTCPGKSDTPVYRLYNQYTGEHFFTTDKAEYDALGEAGWTQEDIAWYGADADAQGAIAVYRLFNPYASHATHIFTTDANEVATLTQLGWQPEGTAWYGLN